MRRTSRGLGRQRFAPRVRRARLSRRDRNRDQLPRRCRQQLFTGFQGPEDFDRLTSPESVSRLGSSLPEVQS